MKKDLFLLLKGIGKVKTIGGKNLQPTFFPLPSAVVSRFGGYFGTITRTNGDIVAMYTELPTLGVCAEGLRHAVSANYGMFKPPRK